MQILQEILLVIALWLVTSAPFIVFIIRSSGGERMTVEQIEKEIADGTHNIYGRVL